MANTYVDIGSGVENFMTADLQVSEGLTWDGKFYYALNANDFIKSDPNAGEIRRVTLAPPSGGTFVGLASTDKDFALLDDDGGGTMKFVTMDYLGNILSSTKMSNDYKRLTFMGKRFFSIRRDNFISELALGGAEVRVDFYDTGGSGGVDGITNDGKYIYVALSSDGSIHKIDLSGNLVQQFFPTSPPVNRGDLTFDGRYLVVSV